VLLCFSTRIRFRLCACVSASHARLSSSTRARHPQCVRFLPQPLPMSASCRPCHNCPKMSSLSPLHARRGSILRAAPNNDGRPCARMLSVQDSCTIAPDPRSSPWQQGWRWRWRWRRWWRQGWRWRWRQGWRWRWWRQGWRWRRRQRQGRRRRWRRWQWTWSRERRRLAEHDGKSFRWRSIKQPTVQVSRAAGVELAWRAPGGTAVACRAGSGGFLGLFTWSCHLVFIVGIVLDLAVLESKCGTGWLSA
jgi:hypothetical protein